MELIKDILKDLKKIDWNEIRDNLESYILIPITSLEFLGTEFQKKIINYLIENGADVNFKDFEGNSALDYTLINDNEILIKFLKEKGAKFDHPKNGLKKLKQ